MASRNIGDKPRHQQSSVVKDMTLLPFGFAVSAAGAILATDNANPPQVFAVAGGSNQEYVLHCPKGNPEKIWVQMWAEGGIVATVSDFSTIVDGQLTIDLASAPLGDTIIQGFLCYGGVSKEGKGAVTPLASIPPEPRYLKSFCSNTANSFLKQLCVIPVGWTSDVNGDVTETRGPLGTVVTHTGVGEYTIDFSHNAPNGFESIWAKIQGASDGRLADITYSSTGLLTSVVVTFTDSANMGAGERASVMIAGPVSAYPDNYGGASGGVHASLATRNIHTYRTYEHLGLIRGGTMIPFHIDIAAGTAGPIEATSNLPPNVRVRRLAAGAYTLYVGRFPAGGLIAEDVKLASGAAIGIVSVVENLGTVAIVAPAGDPGATSISGFLFLKNQSRD